MQLYFSLTSPFARKVRVALIEKGLYDRFEQRVVDPWASDAALLEVNPLLQVPALVLDDGQVLTNSDTILAWIERTYPQPALWPAETAALNHAQAIAALAQGLIEAVVYIVLERRKPAAQQNEPMVEHRLAAIDRVVHAFDTRFDRDDEHFGLDAIGVACALAYIDLRLPGHDWHANHPALAQWQSTAAARPSMRDTAPPN